MIVMPDEEALQATQVKHCAASRLKASVQTHDAIEAVGLQFYLSYRVNRKLAKSHNMKIRH